MSEAQDQPARRHRVWRIWRGPGWPFLGLVTALALFLAGRSLGLLGGGRATDQTDATPAPAQQPARAPQPTPVAATTAPGIEPDRFASLLSLVERQQRQGQAAAGLSTLQELRKLGPNAAQQASLAAMEQELQAGQHQLLEQLTALLLRGEVHAAQAIVLTWPQASELNAPAKPGEAMRQPAVLPRGRAVRAWQAGSAQLAQVADCRSNRITVRIRTEQGWLFPSLPWSAVEPVDPSQTEAVQMGLGCLLAKEVGLARLWVVCARLRAGGNPAEETLTLEQALGMRSQ